MSAPLPSRSDEKSYIKDDGLNTVTHVTEVHEKNEVHRDIKPRQVSMIAIAGTIGTGLFLGSGKAIANGGPVGAVIGYLFMGILVGAMMYCLGEMVCHDPSAGGFIGFATRYVDPALGFASGWNFWWQCSITFAVEVVAASILIQYWDSNDNHLAIYVAVLLLAMILINIIGVKYFGEIEFWFSCLKIVTIIGLIILALVIDLGGGPDKDRRGFRYWREEPFNSEFQNLKPASKARFLGFWAVLTQAAFSYGGIESLASLALEARNPKKTMALATRAVFYRIVGLYVVSIWLLGMTVSSKSPELLGAISEGSGTAAQSPFVVMINAANIKVLPHIINAVVLTSAFSSGNEFLFAASRSLYTMAKDGEAPKIFARTTVGGVPIYSVGFSSLFGLLAFLNVSSGAAQAFNWLSNITTLASMFSWTTVAICYIRFYKAMKVQGMDRNQLPLHAWFQPWAAWVCVITFPIVMLFNGFQSFLYEFNVSDFMASYITVLLFFLLYIGNKICKLTSVIPLETMDLTSHYDRDDLDNTNTYGA